MARITSLVLGDNYPDSSPEFTPLVPYMGRKRWSPTSSSSFFSLSIFLLSSPSRTRLAALFLSVSRTTFSPFPSLTSPDTSNTRPASAFLRWAGVSSSSEFREPDNNLVWTSRCNSASFCALVLGLCQERPCKYIYISTYCSSSAPSLRLPAWELSSIVCVTFATLDDCILRLRGQFMTSMGVRLTIKAFF
jgi:hypothetical protein